MSLVRLLRCSSFLLTSSLFLTLLVTPAYCQDACTAQQPLSQTIVYQQAISINTDVLHNTTFYPIPQAGITITDAPTSLDQITTLSWSTTLPFTTTIQSTMFETSTTTSTTSTTPTLTGSNFDFALLIIDTNQNQKRQSESSYYVNTNGTITSDCSVAPMYAINNGVLTATVNNVSYYYSTSPGVAYAKFVPSTSVGSISTTFSASSSGLLTWSNSQFFNGQAQFCSLSDGTVYAVFQQNAAPSGCYYISLTVFSSMPQAYKIVLYHGRLTSNSVFLCGVGHGTIRSNGRLILPEHVSTCILTFLIGRSR